MHKFSWLSLAILALWINPLKAGELEVDEGIWFRCEFAHSQIPPDDNCRMLDDDGFQIIKGMVHHVKILNSREAACRHNRIGNCFKRDQAGLAAERSEIGPIKFADMMAEVTWLGCTQKYGLTKHPNYLEITPTPEQCWWTPDKRYFVARYRGPVKITDEE
ncbi:MAG: hypothetical protein HOG95_10160 [Rhodospirillaceae bacterium]|nr:hypothetical protein [Rhodospirillaceae bacterium]MBT4589225.1 hypothetical protein [Rhodospirillaceae bacterium]MBT5940285.1 hypothetical protein [Rhodospirillaceae bacterium]MBT7268297.1 hypothetical protein [Rhodospirillaceae bacterium]